MKQPYAALEKLFAHLTQLDRTKAVLHWDLATQMPPKGSAARGEQLSALSELSHALLTDPGVGELIERAKQQRNGLSDWQRANLSMMERRYQHNAAVPSKLQSELVRAGTESEMIWREARPANDFKRFAPALQRVVALVREMAAHKAQALKLSPYDALLDGYDPGMRQATIDPIFAELGAFLPEFIPQALDAQRVRNRNVSLSGVFPKDRQKALGLTIMQSMGFDLRAGRLDESTHPFCGGYLSDVRITTRYNEADPLSALMGVIHETGHALYEQNLPEAWQYQPVGEARGMSIHESQSLLMEMQACRTPEFARYLAPHFSELQAGFTISAESLYGAMTHVERSLIRVEADEVTYPAHILLRYALEKFLLSGEMDVADLPDAWNEGMQRFLGVTPPSDKDGCMQDIHWTDGTFGYFPCYTLGAIAAAQLFAAAKKAQPEILSDLARGEFARLRGWLRENVHQKASLLDTQELLTQATGTPLNVSLYMEYLRGKYLLRTHAA